MSEIKSSTSRTDSLGTEKISKLLVKYAVPSVIGMLTMSLYNLIDSIFIGHGVGPLALAALALAIPVMNLSSAFAVLIGVGSSVQMSIRLGRGDKHGAKIILGNMLVLNVIIGVLFTAISLIFLEDLLLLLGASPYTMDYSRDFMSIILWGNLFSMAFMGLNALMRSTGYPRKAMMITIISIAVNAALAPLFIFVFEWGVRGAAIATLMAQVVGLTIEIHHYFNKKRLIHFRRGIYNLRSNIVRSILSVGLSPFILNVGASVVVVILNRALLAYGGDLYVGAYGIINRWAFVFSMAVIGINQGVQPIIGYNYGANNYDRMTRAFKQTAIVATLVTTIGGVAAMAFPRSISGMFTTDPELIAATVEGFRYMMMLFPLVGFQMLVSTFFMSINKPQKSILISVTRQIVLLIPFLYILPTWFGVDGVWMSIPVADGLSVILAIAMVTATLRKLKHEVAL